MKNINKYRKTATLLAIIMIASVFSISAFAKKSEETNPIEALWNAILGIDAEINELQSQVSSLQTQLNTRASKTGIISISPADFGTQYITRPYDLYIASSTTYLHLYAPLHLPQGVTITRLGLHAYDGSTTDNCVLTLHKQTYNNAPSTGSFYPEQLASLYSTDTTTGTYSLSTTTDIESPYFNHENVDNTDGSYFLTLHIPADEPLKFYNAFIEYEYPD